MTIRLLVSGERDWVDEQRVYQVLEKVVQHFNTQDLIIVHGDCPSGADHFAELYANKHRIKTERHQARWEEGGLSAGPKRNTHMVKLGADILVCFWSGKTEKSGSFDCLTKAVRHGIPVRIVPRKRQ